MRHGHRHEHESSYGAVYSIFDYVDVFDGVLNIDINVFQTKLVPCKPFLFMLSSWALIISIVMAHHDQLCEAETTVCLLSCGV